MIHLLVSKSKNTIQTAEKVRELTMLLVLRWAPGICNMKGAWDRMMREIPQPLGRHHPHLHDRKDAAMKIISFTAQMLLVDSENKGHFLRIITKAKFYPLPNSKDQSGHKAMIFEPSSIEGHVYLETRSSRSVEIDGAVGCMGFLAKKCNYLHTEHLISRGYDQPNVKFKLIRSNERSKAMPPAN
ncbi:hypothetical protein L208DRAFT_491211 [Tricholoma matsutake]|nr:hypothetical protein L208DRAFT_491211 [Tricholoma matsutake 945]